MTETELLAALDTIFYRTKASPDRNIMGAAGVIRALQGAIVTGSARELLEVIGPWSKEQLALCQRKSFERRMGLDSPSEN